MTQPVSPSPPPPMSLLAELTHRCPLSCPYCSNPLQLEKKTGELETSVWKRVLDEAAEMGILQVHFSGGEPMARPDLPELVAHARRRNLYTNLITSGVLLNEVSLKALDEAGLDHVQLSFQDVLPVEAERMSGLKGVQERKLKALALLEKSDMALTLNFVLHRHNLARIPDMFALARTHGAQRVEMAHTQYYGWALQNRAALLPTKEQLEEAEILIRQERAQGGLAIDYVTPDYYAARPKPCMGGWGQRFLNITPSGRVLPCHAAETIPGIAFPHILEDSLQNIWDHAPVFTLFRGTDWMPEPCAHCEHKEEDWGGCRCQALALTGNARNTDPVCALSPYREFVDTALAAAQTIARDEVANKGRERHVLIYRRFDTQENRI